MLAPFHRLITTQALSAYFHPKALEVIISANLGQDSLRGQVGHPEYHFDQNAFAASSAYIERNRQLIHSALEARQPLPARQALGRLTHAAQDFYAHSNYVTRWLSRFPEGHWPPPDEIDPLDDSLLQGAELRSGKIYLPLEPLAWIPGIGQMVLQLLPRDSHAWMNLDSPRRGPAFAYALAAAIKRTRREYELTIEGLPSALVAVFTK